MKLFDCKKKKKKKKKLIDKTKNGKIYMENNY